VPFRDFRLLTAIGVVWAGSLGSGCTPSSPRGREVSPGSGLKVEWSLPAGFLINEQAPSSLELIQTDKKGNPSTLRAWGLSDLKKGQVEFVIDPGLSRQELFLDARFYLCQKEHLKLCTLTRKKERLYVLEKRAGPEEPKQMSGIFWKIEPELGGTRVSE